MGLKRERISQIVNNFNFENIYTFYKKGKDGAGLDLFDWLGIIGRLKAEGLTQKEIGEKIGWSRDMVTKHFKILNSIVTEVLELCKKHQKGRVPKNVTDVTFDFTEGWFRNSPRSLKNRIGV